MTCVQSVVCQIGREQGGASEHLATELRASDPPDVRFRDAAFEIKEILDEGRRRHADLKEGLEKAKAARVPSDLLEPLTPRDITYNEVSESC